MLEERRLLVLQVRSLDHRDDARFDNRDDYGSGGDLARRVERFVAEYYLARDGFSDDQIRQLYAPRVQYFGKRNVSIERVVADKRAYYRRWPVRDSWKPKRVS